jgi:hypothetical protein
MKITEPEKALSISQAWTLEKMMGRVGIEPTTKRLKGCPGNFRAQ